MGFTPFVPTDIPALDQWLREFLDASLPLLKDIPLTQEGVDLYNGQEATPWARGGCAILAFALQEWLGKHSKVVAFNDAHGPLHVATLIEDLLLDGYGVSQIDRRLEEVQEYVNETAALIDWIGGEPPEVRLRSFSRARALKVGIPVDAVITAQLLRSLAQVDPLSALGLAPQAEILLPI